jgi:hypothetical protein
VPLVFDDFSGIFYTPTGRYFFLRIPIRKEVNVHEKIFCYYTDLGNRGNCRIYRLRKERATAAACSTAGGNSAACPDSAACSGSRARSCTGKAGKKVTLFAMDTAAVITAPFQWGPFIFYCRDRRV